MPKRSGHLMMFKPSALLVVLVALTLAFAGTAGGEQRAIGRVQQMPRLPRPLVVRDWPQLAREYYELLLDPATRLDGHPLVAVDASTNQYKIPSYVGPKPDDEAFTCLAPVIGAKLVGLDPSDLYGCNDVRAATNWYDPQYGIYRHRLGDRGQPVVHSGVYGYWAATQGLVLASQYPDDPEFAAQARTTAQAFLRLAKGLGCPENADFDVLGFNFDTGRADGRAEPMNRLGHAPTVAWILLVGSVLTGDREMLDCARSALQWHIDHPGRYEVTHLAGPLTAARLNAEYGCALDMDGVLAAWFGDGDAKAMPWKVTAGFRFGRLTCDGLDGAYWGGAEEGFHAFSMGTLHGPAWLVPMVRYDPRYARDVGRYALHAAASARLLQGHGLDWDHQDHRDWKDRWDPQCLFFYEALTPWEWSDRRTFRPYATGDRIRLGWGVPKVEPAEYLREKEKWFSATSHNLSLYMGNHIGFLGGIVSLTNVHGILRWDCLATDWYHAAAYPTFLLFNPHSTARTVEVHVGPEAADLYDAVTGQFLKRDVRDATSLILAADSAAVVVLTPPDGELTREGRRALVDNIVVDWQR